MQSLTIFLLAVACQAQTYFNNDTYFQTAGGSSDCASGYQAITDEKACKEVAGAISTKQFNAIYHYYPVNPFPEFCTTKLDDVNYYVNPEGVHTDPLVSVLCIQSVATCSVSDGSGVSSSYPCVCGTDTCATGEVCRASANLCETIKGYYETERKAKTCPSGYQVITDEGACQEVAGKISSKMWGAVDSYTTMPHGCVTWQTDTINYYVNPGGANEDVDVALLCIRSLATCDVQDGSGVSSFYPCVCGTDTCSTGEVCVASSNLCETIKGYYETERKVSACPSGYQVITDEAACREVAGMIGGEVWGSVYSYSQVVHGCGTMVDNRVNYYVNPGAIPLNMHVENALLCIKSSLTCDVSDGSGVSSSYPCVCGTDNETDTCATGELCVASANLCETIKGYYETEREANSCPNGYQVITDAAACRELAGMISGKTWGSVYADTTLAHGCGTHLTHEVNYYVNPGGVNTDVENSLLCIDSSMVCDVSDGSGVSSSYPCVCGTDTCASGEVCIERNNRCEVTTGYYETERRVQSCPSGYKMIDEAACWELNKKLGKTWIQFPIYSGVAPGCGTWNFDTVSYFEYLGGGLPSVATNSENALLCVSDSENITYNQCENPYTWGACQ